MKSTLDNFQNYLYSTGNNFSNKSYNKSFSRKLYNKSESYFKYGVSFYDASTAKSNNTKKISEQPFKKDNLTLSYNNLSPIKKSRTNNYLKNNNINHSTSNSTNIPSYPNSYQKIKKKKFLKNKFLSQIEFNKTTTFEFDQEKGLDYNFLKDITHKKENLKMSSNKFKVNSYKDGNNRINQLKINNSSDIKFNPIVKFDFGYATTSRGVTNYTFGNINYIKKLQNIVSVEMKIRDDINKKIIEKNKEKLDEFNKTHFSPDIKLPEDETDVNIEDLYEMKCKKLSCPSLRSQNSNRYINVGEPLGRSSKPVYISLDGKITFPNIISDPKIIHNINSENFILLKNYVMKKK